MTGTVAYLAEQEHPMATRLQFRQKCLQQPEFGTSGDQTLMRLLLA